MEYSSSRRILQDVHKYCPNIKVDFAYSLARGGVAIHTACQSDCDLLAKELPAEAFGGGVKHPPTGKGRRCNTVYIKGVNTSVEIPSLGGFLQKEGGQYFRNKATDKTIYWQTNSGHKGHLRSTVCS